MKPPHDLEFLPGFELKPLQQGILDDRGWFQVLGKESLRMNGRRVEKIRQERQEKQWK